MKLNKIGIIGHFCINGNMTNGQTVKTREVSNYLESYFQEETLKFDTYKNRKKPFKIIKNTYTIIKNSENVIFMVSRNGYRVLLPLIVFFNIFYKRRIFEFVIGGRRYEVFDKGKITRKLSNKIEKIYVETQRLKDEYNKRNVYNVEVLPNFKNTTPIDKNEIKNTNKNKIRVCTFTRVAPAKGIEEAIETINNANEKLNKEAFELDIYGEIDKNYKGEFEEIKEQFPRYIKYKGCASPNNNTPKILKKYDVMLFLTHWRGEGFPGTIIDAFNSALPVIATDWKYNFDILEDGKTGIKVAVKDTTQATDALIKLYENQEKLIQMKYACLEESKKYTPEQAMEKFIKELENEG